MRALLVLLVLLHIVHAAPSHAATLEDFKLGGRVNLQVPSRESFKEFSFDKEAQFDVELRRRGGIRAVTDVKVSTESRALELRELFVDYEGGASGGDAAESRWTAGRAKKRFGLDWDLSMEERLTLERGAIYRKLGALAFSGRDSMVGFRSARGGASPFNHDLSMHTSEGLNAAALYRLEWKLAGPNRLISSSLVQMHSISGDWRWAQAQALSYAGNGEPLRFESELFVGKDFIETEYNSQKGSGSSVVFSALSAAALWKAPALQPFARAGVILHDLSSLGRRTLEGVLGARIYFRKRVYFGGEIALLKTSTGGLATVGRPPETFDSNARFLFALRYFF